MNVMKLKTLQQSRITGCSGLGLSRFVPAFLRSYLRKACELFGITDIRILHSPEPFRLRKSPEVVEAFCKKKD